jgi:hypothetical protein
LLSPQVLQEFLANAIRKPQRPIALAQARDIVRAYGTWVRNPFAETRAG